MGQKTHELSYEGVILHILNFGIDSFYTEIKTGLILCMGYACVLSDKPVVFLSRFKSTIIVFFSSLPWGWVYPQILFSVRL